MELLNQILLSMSVFLAKIVDVAMLQRQGDGHEFPIND